MLSFILFFVLILLLLHFTINNNKKAEVYLSIPGPPLKFIIGNTLDIMHSPDLFRLVRERASFYNGIYRYYAFNIGTINIYNAEDIEIITSNKKYNEKSFVYKFLKPWLQDGLLVSSGEKWQSRRKILTPAFHFNILQKYYQIVSENNVRLLQYLEKTSGKTFDILPVMSEYTLHTICETAMGTRLSEDANTEGKLYIESIHELVGLILKRFANMIYISDFIFNCTSFGKQHQKCVSDIHNFTRNVIKMRRHNLDLNSNNKKKTLEINSDSNVPTQKKMFMLDLLLIAEKNGFIDSVGIQEEVDTFMFAGHDTTGVGITYCLLSLANAQDVQEKIVEELKTIFGNDTRPATMNDLANMRYLDCCVKESLRLYPPVPFISRKIAEETILSNYKIPAGTTCHIHIFDLHRQKNIFKDPLKFDPDRFLPKNCVGRHNYAYMPFSAGPRNCIGQKFAMIEMKSALTEILRNFKLLPVTKHSDLKFISDIVLRNSGPVYVKFVKRTAE